MSMVQRDARVARAASEAVAARMSRTRQRDTEPELALRRNLHALGLRYRVDKPVLADRRRRVDVVFGPARVAVFVDGCFWHGCPEHGTFPSRNAKYWREKIEANRARDADTNARLAAAGWSVIRVWEHDDMGRCAAEIAALVRARRSNAVPASLTGGREDDSSRASFGLEAKR